jgi:hypothetical protein
VIAQVSLSFPPTYALWNNIYIEIDNRGAVQLWNPHHNNFAKVQKRYAQKISDPFRLPRTDKRSVLSAAGRFHIKSKYYRLPNPLSYETRVYGNAQNYFPKSQTATSVTNMNQRSVLASLATKK